MNLLNTVSYQGPDGQTVVLKLYQDSHGYVIERHPPYLLATGVTLEEARGLLAAADPAAVNVLLDTVVQAP